MLVLTQPDHIAMVFEPEAVILGAARGPRW
jgi:hypothetical protein